MPEQLRPDNEPVRLQKFLSQAGVCSRRKGEALMKQGRVEVNGEVARKMGTHVTPGKDEVRVDGEVVEIDDPIVYIAVNKPRRVITSLDDPEGRPTVASLIPRVLPRIWPVGRLDWDSEGLLLMTNDGNLTHLLTHPSSHVEKSYNVKVPGRVDADHRALEAMRSGVTLDDGFKTSSAQIEVLNHTSKNTWLSVVIHEGHNRQIRRMCEAVHLDVLKLRRVGVGPLALDPLKPGRFRFLLPSEVEALYEAAGEPPPAELEKYDTTKLAKWVDSRIKASRKGKKGKRKKGKGKGKKGRGGSRRKNKKSRK